MKGKTGFTGECRVYQGKQVLQRNTGYIRVNRVYRGIQSLVQYPYITVICISRQRNIKKTTAN